MKKGKIRAKTRAKLDRLARELEAANGLRIQWSSGIFEGRRWFMFEPTPKLKKHRCLFGCTGFSFSVGEALRTFYVDFAHLLMDEARFSREERGDYITGLDDYKPARYPLDKRIYAQPGVHGLRVIVSEGGRHDG